MFDHKISLVLAAIFSLLLFSSMSLAAAEQNKQSDTWLEAKLVTSYTLNEHLNPFKIDVEVISGVATITGEVDSDIERDLAVEIARSIEGITEVKENLTIEPREKREQENEFARQVDDATTTAKVKYRLLLNRNTDSLDINVDTEDNVVTLSGTADSAEKKDLAVKLAQNTSGVREVKDKLTVAPGRGMVEGVGSTMKKQMEELTGEVKDTWITAKAKTVLLISNEADGAVYDVSTNNGTIMVTGTVLSEKQKAEIQQILEALQGVRKVENRLGIR